MRALTALSACALALGGCGPIGEAADSEDLTQEGGGSQESGDRDDEDEREDNARGASEDESDDD